jgi:predicted type IV restriction endonuclease
MTQLSEALVDVREKIARYAGKEVNEQNTKTALIDPVLRALGWDLGDLEEVQQEYKRRPRDKPVDYALLVLRTPRLFVEAKALGQDLKDRKWANQVMGYATVAGVEWVVITNGDEYRIYNACAAVPVEEKVFRTVALSDPNSPVEETLSLLSKERIRENEIQVLWNAHFVDRQVLAALEKLFAAEPDPSLIRVVKKRAKELSSQEIKASLQRVRANFDFPVQPERTSDARKLRRSAIAKKIWENIRAVSLVGLIQAGFLKPPLKLTRRYKGHDLEAELLPDGTVAFRGKSFRSPSTAATFARSTVIGQRKNTNGWVFWRYRDEHGKTVPLDAARQEFLKRRTSAVG